MGSADLPYVSSHVTSKFAIRAFSECLRQELAGDKDINVVTILPQSVDTPVFRQAGNYTDRAARAVPPVSTPEEVADRIVRCARDPRREVTEGRAGQVIETLHALAPGLYGRILPYLFEHAVFGPESAEPGPGNVFEPAPKTTPSTGTSAEGTALSVARPSWAARPLRGWVSSRASATSSNGNPTRTGTMSFRCSPKLAIRRITR